jgi:hypothetical protein
MHGVMRHHGSLAFVTIVRTNDYSRFPHGFSIQITS